MNNMFWIKLVLNAEINNKKWFLKHIAPLFSIKTANGEKENPLVRWDPGVSKSSAKFLYCHRHCHRRQDIIWFVNIFHEKCLLKRIKKTIINYKEEWKIIILRKYLKCFFIFWKPNGLSWRRTNCMQQWRVIQVIMQQWQQYYEYRFSLESFT